MNWLLFVFFMGNVTVIDVGGRQVVCEDYRSLAINIYKAEALCAPIPHD